MQTVTINLPWLWKLTFRPIPADSTPSVEVDITWKRYSHQAKCWNLSANELTRNLSGNIRRQSSQLAEPLWTDPDIKSRISACELVSTSKKKKKKEQAGSNWSYSLPKSLQTKKKQPPPLSLTFFVLFFWGYASHFAMQHGWLGARYQLTQQGLWRGSRPTWRLSHWGLEHIMTITSI